MPGSSSSFSGLVSIRGLVSIVKARGAAPTELVDKIKKALNDVASLDHDRIVRSFLAVIQAVVRTNFYVAGPPSHRAEAAAKTDPGSAGASSGVRDLRLFAADGGRPSAVRAGRPRRHPLVGSCRGLPHRGAWLGQGADGEEHRDRPGRGQGRVLLQAFAGSREREAWLAEGLACYQLFVTSLLDVTDNIVGGVVVPPADVVRYDGDDPYLVVAADKGTATFSDAANKISVDAGFWLGDAFASGGSAGYDHKAMGITARGAWVSVCRHFREMGLDPETTDFTCVGIGDMSGDVFGNGVLLSKHLKLVAAFDHRHIMIDPQPDPARSWEERARLFALPRSSWADYDTSLLSEGGGVFPRTLKSIVITEQMRSALGIDKSVEALTPAELIKACLRAPVDLLWNGGIGTFVKAMTETNDVSATRPMTRCGSTAVSYAPSVSARAETSA